MNPQIRKRVAVYHGRGKITKGEGGVITGPLGESGERPGKKDLDGRSSKNGPVNGDNGIKRKLARR